MNVHDTFPATLLYTLPPNIGVAIHDHKILHVTDTRPDDHTITVRVTDIGPLLIKAVRVEALDTLPPPDNTETLLEDDYDEDEAEP